ncbi:DUF2945 domain-containing protein [Streptomyces sp. VB1]|uniref:DUF2945 domain-containing protein n=1 Tax=Streptomyces sp. VB1 TaxID=2986803 RepID=UPI002241E7A6|nr:DUF2945 domain-containing protein [Streptomyces sp. VB1]UZI27104.1 DUF2945 domain-containing protein [Streptomyces sp. VB1]
MAKKKKLSKGDDVVWQSHGQDVEGTVTGEIEERTERAGRTVDASRKEPQYEVRSDKTGKKAVHRPESLDRKKDRGRS